VGKLSIKFIKMFIALKIYENVNTLVGNKLASNEGNVRMAVYGELRCGLTSHA